MFWRVFKYSVKNILRNAFLSFSTILVLTLLMFFINVLIALDDVGTKVMDSINEKISISLYLKEEYTKSTVEIADLITDLEDLEKGIAITYKDKEEVLEEVRDKYPNLVNILEKNNPLPNTIDISWVDLEDYEAVNKIIENKMYVLSDEEEDGYFANYSTQFKRIQVVTQALSMTKMLLSIVIWVFFFSIAVISYSVISNFIYYYKDEIYITKLVGGSNIFIYGPFVLQGIIFAVISFFLNVLIFQFLLKNLVVLFPNFIGFTTSPVIMLAELIIFVLIGGLSWYFSSRKLVKSNITK